MTDATTATERRRTTDSNAMDEVVGQPQYSRLMTHFDLDRSLVAETEYHETTVLLDAMHEADSARSRLGETTQYFLSSIRSSIYERPRLDRRLNLNNEDRSHQLHQQPDSNSVNRTAKNDCSWRIPTSNCGLLSGTLPIGAPSDAVTSCDVIVATTL